MRKLLLSFILTLSTLFPFIGIAGPSDAVFNIFTYKADGTILANGYGFFINGQGEGVVSFNLLKGAYRAEIIDAKGKKFNVVRILGANSVLDLAKFRTDSHKTPFLEQSTTTPENGTLLNLATYKSTGVAAIITNVSDFNQYKYFDLNAQNVDKNFGCPLIDNNRRVAAIVQKNFTNGATTACALDIKAINTLNITETGSLNPDLKEIKIQKALPNDEKAALAYIYLMSSADSTAYITTLNDFIEIYPDNAEGFVNRGTFYATKKLYSLAEKDFKTALSKSSEKSTIKADGIHFTLSKLMYNVALQTSNNSDWTLPRALEEAELAYQANPSPLYLMQQGHCLYANKQYDKAYDAYNKVNTTNFASPESFYAAANALSFMKGDSTKVLALLDSCVSRLNKPYSKSDANYLFVRAQYLTRLGKFRQAVADYNDYESAMGPASLTAKFYYIREQAERSCRMYKQAIDDIRYAQTLSQKPEYFDYRLEEVSLWLIAGEFQTAIDAGEALIKELPDNADAYRLLGIAYGELKNKTKAISYLNKAKQLGDTSVESFMKKYQ